MRKSIQSLAAALILIGISAGVQAATIATYDVSVSVSGTQEVSGQTAIITGTGSNGTGILDDTGIFTINDLDPLLINVSVTVPLLGTSTGSLDWKANGTIIGSYSSINATSSSLTGNSASLMITENSACSASGLFGNTICGEVSDLIDISQIITLNAAEGLADPLVFDLANDSTFVLGTLGGAATLEMTLSNPVLSPVPLPAAAWLFGSALLGLGLVKRRKA